MIIIRLKKLNVKNDFTYSIVVSDPTKAANSNKFIEKIGFYKPLVDKWSNKYLFVDFDRLRFWLKRGAKMNTSIFLLIKPLLEFYQK